MHCNTNRCRWIDIATKVSQAAIISGSIYTLTSIKKLKVSISEISESIQSAEKSKRRTVNPPNFLSIIYCCLSPRRFNFIR